MCDAGQCVTTDNFFNLLTAVDCTLRESRWMIFAIVSNIFSYFTDEDIKYYPIIVSRFKLLKISTIIVVKIKRYRISTISCGKYFPGYVSLSPPPPSVLNCIVVSRDKRLILWSRRSSSFGIVQ